MSQHAVIIFPECYYCSLTLLIRINDVRVTADEVNSNINMTLMYYGHH